MKNEKNNKIYSLNKKNNPSFLHMRIYDNKKFYTSNKPKD